MTASTFFSVLRPKTLTGAAAPVVLALSLAWYDGHWAWAPALLCLAFALLMQMNANVVNDLVDGLRGRDTKDRKGPQRALASGLATAGELKAIIAGLTLLSAACGLPLIYYGGWWMLGIGLLCALFCALYSTTLAQRGMGDLLVLVFFGLVPVMATYYLQSGTVTLPVALLALGMGLATDTLLIVNNYRDIEEDKQNGKHTICVALGPKASRWLYLFVGIAAAILSIVALTMLDSRLPATAMLLYLPQHVVIHGQLSGWSQRPSSPDWWLKHTSINILIYSLSHALALYLSTTL